MIGSTYSDFLSVVAEGRRMSPDAVREVAKGRVWSGSQALQVIEGMWCCRVCCWLRLVSGGHGATCVCGPAFAKDGPDVPGKGQATMHCYNLIRSHKACMDSSQVQWVTQPC